MSDKVVRVVAPNGNKYPLTNVDEGARFMFILTNGYLDIAVDALREKLEGDEPTHTCGGGTVEVVEADLVAESKSYTVSKGDVVETVHTAEAIAHICDCTINTVVNRLTKDPSGFTVKGWTVALKK